jgi:HAD superfamily hydrolase (TIGR01509 family)
MSAILFDMDGTIIDSEPLWLEAEIKVMAELGFYWDFQDQINYLGGPMDRTEKYMQERSGNIKPYGYFRERLNQVMKEKFDKELVVIPGALELIKDCKQHGVKTALVTASGRDLMMSAVKRFPDDAFDVCISRDDVKNSKPDPEPYLKAAIQLNVDISKCIIFEDSVTGLTSAISSGAQVIAVSHLIEIPEQPNVLIVESINEITFNFLLHRYPFLKENALHD